MTERVAVPKLRRIGKKTIERLAQGANITPRPEGYLITLDVPYGFLADELQQLFAIDDRDFLIDNRLLEPQYFNKVTDIWECGIVKKELLIAHFGTVDPLEAAETLARWGFHAAGIEECAALFRTPHLTRLRTEAHVGFPRGAEKKTLPAIFPPDPTPKQVTGVWALFATPSGDWGTWCITYFKTDSRHRYYYVGVRDVR